MNNIFDLGDRVRHGLNFLNQNVDKKKGNLPYFWTIFESDPAEARHDWPDFGDLTSRYIEAFIVARRMLGLPELFNVEKAQRKLLISYFNEGDGLNYRPKPEKSYYSTIFKREYDAHVAEGFEQARVLWALLEWYVESNDPLIRKRIFELINGLDRVLIKKDDYGYYDRSTIEPGTVVDPNSCPMPNQYYFCGTQIHPLIEVYRRLGNEKAGEMARRITNYIVYHSDYFFSDGSWNCQRGDDWSTEINGHTHSRFATIAGVVIFAVLNNDRELVSKMKNCYDWFVKHHCSSFGWSPEFLGRFGDENEGCETCAIMDQIHCCLAFCEAGYTEYYEQAERLCRNQLFENQMLDTHLVRNTVEKADTDLSCFHNVAEMVRGGFAGWAGPNDFIGNCDHSSWLMNCCGPAGIRALYDIWENIYTVRGTDVYVNIFLDRNGTEIDIKNYQPRKGLVEIMVKKRCNLYLASRLWLDLSNFKLNIDGTEFKPAIKNGYFEVGELAENSNIQISYSTHERMERSRVNGRDYTLTWRGDTVVKIDPPGRFMPFYTGRIKEQ